MTSALPLNVSEEAPAEFPPIESPIERFHPGTGMAVVEFELVERSRGGIILPHHMRKVFKTGYLRVLGPLGRNERGEEVEYPHKIGAYVLFGLLDRNIKIPMDLGEGMKDYYLVDQDEIFASIELKEGASTADLGIEDEEPQ